MNSIRTLIPSPRHYLYVLYSTGAVQNILRRIITDRDVYDGILGLLRGRLLVEAVVDAAIVAVAAAASATALEEVVAALLAQQPKRERNIQFLSVRENCCKLVEVLKQ